MIFKIESGGITFQCGIESDDHFADVVFFDPFFDPIEAERICVTPIKGGEKVFNHMIKPAVIASFFDCVGVTGRSEDAKRGCFAVATKPADPPIGEAAANGTGRDFSVEIYERFSQGFQDGPIPREEFKSESFSRACPHAREPF